ncbi:hypothetical protein HQ545_04755 [Candidatus Woesearchaeota archaeon]|nr:hypothetical protein [Candidatus Woesearchaeota archaeon]
MVDLKSIDTAFNSGRETILSSLSTLPIGLNIKGLFILIALVMIAVLFRNLTSGREERKGIYGPLAIIVFSLSVVFGFRIILVAWILIFLLTFGLLNKIKDGEWKGVLMMLIPMYVLCSIVSVKSYLVIVFAVIVTIIGGLARRANFFRVFGRGEESKMLAKHGFPVGPERRIIRKLNRESKRKFRISRDHVVAGAALMLHLYSLRMAKKEEEGMRQAGMVATTEEIGKNLYEQEEASAKIEEQDMAYMEKILRLADQLKVWLARTSADAVDKAIQGEIMARAHQILGMMHNLVKHKLEEEHIMKKSGDQMREGMEILKHSSKEARQLEERKADFNEMGRASRNNIKTISHAIDKESREITRGIKRENSNLNVEGARERIHMMVQREKQLHEFNKRIGMLGGTLKHVEDIFKKVNTKEDRKIERIAGITSKAEHHEKRLHNYMKQYSHEADILQKKFKVHSRMMKKDRSAISDEQLLELTNGTIDMMDNIKNLGTISLDYHQNELVPLSKELAAMDVDLKHLSDVSQKLTQVYYRLESANTDMLKVAEGIDQNPNSKKALVKMIETQQFEESITKKAYRQDKSVSTHIDQGYRYVKAAYEHIQKQLSIQAGQQRTVVICQKQTAKALNDAFMKLMKRKIHRTNLLEDETVAAQKEVETAERNVKAARAEI